MPAPDGAISPVIVPAGSMQEKSRNTVFAPYALHKFRITISCIYQILSSHTAQAFIKAMKTFSNARLMTTITSVHANKSGVSRYTFACWRHSPIEPRGIPITSAAIPAFQHRPSADPHAEWKYGITCGRYTYRMHRTGGTRNNLAISKS